MDCVEARRLLDQDVVPGAHTAQSSQLGFHLARCAACRAYRPQRETLLAALLDAPLDTPSSTGQIRIPARQSASDAVQHTAIATQGQRRPSLRALIRVVALCFGIGTLIIVFWLGGIATRTFANIAAMTISPVPAANLATSTQSIPSANAVMIAPPLVATVPIARSVATNALPAATTTVETTRSPLLTATNGITSGVPTPHPLPATSTPVPSPMFVHPEAAPTPPASSNTAVATASDSQTQAPPAGNAITVLILGNDRRPGEQEVPRTDAIMLARINPQTGHIALLSLPRDLWVTIPGYGASRINAAYVWGEIYHADGGGLGLTKATLSQLTGVPIDYVVMADFQGFMNAIDSIGGITVDVDKTLDDPSFPTLDYGYTHAHFDPGPQQMDGLTALTYSRVRHPDSDFARIKRQQAVLIGIGKRLRERGDLQNLLAADTITSALRAYVQTDMPPERVLGLVWALRSTDVTRVERFALEPAMVSFGIGDDRYAEVAVPGAIEDLVRQWYNQ